MPTAREEIEAALKANLWEVASDSHALGAAHLRMRLQVTFDGKGQVRRAILQHPKPFNRGTIRREISKDKRYTVLAFIRGEKNIYAGQQ